MTEVQSYLENMKIIQTKLLNYIDNEENIEENYQNIINLFDDEKIRSEKPMLQAIRNFSFDI